MNKIIHNKINITYENYEPVFENNISEFNIQSLNDLKQHINETISNYKDNYSLDIVNGDLMVQLNMTSWYQNTTMHEISVFENNQKMNFNKSFLQGLNINDTFNDKLSELRDDRESDFVNAINNLYTNELQL